MDNTELASSEDGARRESKSIDEKATKAAVAGLSEDRKVRLERLFKHGAQIAAQHPDTPGPHEVVNVIRKARRERSIRNS